MLADSANGRRLLYVGGAWLALVTGALGVGVFRMPPAEPSAAGLGSRDGGANGNAALANLLRSLLGPGAVMPGAPGVDRPGETPPTPWMPPARAGRRGVS